MDLMLMIFPELKNIKIFSRLNSDDKNLLKEKDFIFLLSLMIIDDTDNTDYFLYKFNISKKDQKRIKNIDIFYKEKINSKTFTKNSMNKVFYYQGKEAALDILNYRKVKSKKEVNLLKELCNYYENKEAPIMPINANFLMKRYEIPQGKQLGEKLKIIEEEWVNNDFKISDNEVENIVNN
jgi:poly(A) polymerase